MSIHVFSCVLSFTFCNNDCLRKTRVSTTGRTILSTFFPSGFPFSIATNLRPPAHYTSLETFLFPLSRSCTTVNVSCTALFPFPIVSHKRVFVTSSSLLGTISCEQSGCFIAVFLRRPWIEGNEVNDVVNLKFVIRHRENILITRQ